MILIYFWALLQKASAIGDVAQLVELGIHKPSVTGSNPVVAISKPCRNCEQGFFFNICNVMFYNDLQRINFD